MRTVRVEASSAYDVLIGPGLLGECGARIAKVIAPCTAALVSDSNVAPLYAARVRESLETAGFRSISVDREVYRRIYREIDRFYNPTPIFCITAEK